MHEEKRIAVERRPEPLELAAQKGRVGSPALTQKVEQRALVCPPAWRARPGAMRQGGIREQLPVGLALPEASRRSPSAAWKDECPAVADLERSLDNSLRLQRALCRTRHKISATLALRQIPAATQLQAEVSQSVV